MKLLLFDIDGTLLIGKGLGRRAKKLAMQAIFGTDAGIEDFPFGGKTDWQILKEILAPHGWTEAQIGEKMPEYESQFAVSMREVAPEFDVQVLPDAHEIVQAMVARDDVIVALVTGNSSMTAPIKLEAGGFNPDDFVVGAYGNESANRNDLPILAHQRAEVHCNCKIAPEDIIIIGDTVADVLAARAVGGQVVTVFTGFEDRELLIQAEPDIMLDDLTQFMEQVVAKW